MTVEGLALLSDVKDKELGSSGRADYIMNGHEESLLHGQYNISFAGPCSAPAFEILVFFFRTPVCALWILVYALLLIFYEALGMFLFNS